MSVLESIVSASFKKSDTGATLFYPWGTLGRGYVVPDSATEEAIRRFVRRYYIVTLVVVVGSVVLLGPFVTLVLLVPLVAWYALWARGTIRTLEGSAERMTYGESTIAMAGRLPFAVLALLLAFSILFAVAGLVLTLVAQTIVGILCLVFFGACSYVYVRMIIAKRRQAKDRK